MDKSRRNYLKAAIGTMVGVGAIAVVKSCNRSMMPSEKMKTEFIDNLPYKIIDISKLEEGQRIIVEFLGRPIAITKRSKKIIQKLKEPNNELRDPYSEWPQQPDGVDSVLRSYRDDIFVYVNVCTHLGCSTEYVRENDEDELYQPKSGIGGSVCPCHGAIFDASGRVLKGSPAVFNLLVPNYEFVDDSKIKLTGIIKGSTHKEFYNQKK